LDLIKINKDVPVGFGRVLEGTLLLAELSDDGSQYFVDDGSHLQGLMLHASHCNIVPQWKELQRERQLLLRQIERTIDEQRKPELPREVVASIGNVVGRTLYLDRHEFELLTDWSHLETHFKSDYVVLNAFYKSNPVVYVDALVNGYTVEQTNEERFEGKMRHFLKPTIMDWLQATPVGNDLDTDAAELVRQIMILVKRMHAERA